MKIYVLVKNIEADVDYSWDYTPYEIIEANTSRARLEEIKKEYEKLNGGEVWEEYYDNFTCCYTIEEVELKGESLQ